MYPPVIRSVLVCLAVLALGLPSAFAQTTERVSVDSIGLEGNSGSSWPNISSDGRFVVFYSWADNLVPGDTNGFSDVFVHDRQTGQVSRVSVDSVGAQANFSSFLPTVSADGRYVSFDSFASNLVPGDARGLRDVFVHDRLSGATSRVSVSSSGAEGDGESFGSSLSQDGRFVAFQSSATNLVPNDTNGKWDIFVHDQLTHQTERVSVSSTGAQGNESCWTYRGPSISANGRFVAFLSHSSNLVAGDTNGDYDVFLHDRNSGQTQRVSVASSGAEANATSGWNGRSVSDDGNRTAFSSIASNLVPGDTNGAEDIFVHNRQTGQTTRVSVDAGGVQGNSSSWEPSISSDGRFVAFQSVATNFVPGDTNNSTDIFVHDLQTGKTTRVSVDSGGIQSNSWSSIPSLSADGRFVAFYSHASNLVPGDTNGWEDVFVHDRGASGPNLAKNGTCPGQVNLTISNATANGPVAIVHGPAGVFVKPTPPCQGLTLGVSPPSLGAVRTADGTGVAILNFNAPPGACGRSVQAVDVTTCLATNTIVL